MYAYAGVRGFFVIATFGDLPTKALFDGSPRKGFKSLPSEIHAVAVRKLDMLNAATTLGDLRRSNR